MRRYASVELTSCVKEISHHVEEDFNVVTDVVEQRKKKDRHSNPIYFKII
jgi:hypothetical protein